MTLQPIQEPRGAPRSQYERPLQVGPRRMQERYVQSSSPRLSSFDRLPAQNRRPSEQEVVLPSVERDIVDLISPRRVTAPQRPFQEPLSHQSADPRSQQQQQVIDLTTSPYRPPTSGDRGYYVPARSYTYAEPNGLTHATVPSRRSPVREMQGAYYEGPTGEPPRAYMPDTRMHERRAPPGHDYFPLRDERQRPQIAEESARFLRSGVRYGG
ncbi:hypothetical protein EJ02DRAFT_267218 [Clathrospora elynae]|uniref:Uncharacterized protein n=1 Tax=Clathrospora elynae TaxID=706981 RepID=A0A6A5SPC1_9PLEO|nr:hypothetical protein EJ02DRAFT_267218 [Clathrospora elynae]